MSKKYDVIIAGLGPSGAASALELSMHGAKVMVLEANPKHSKPCGGCISMRWSWLLEWLKAPEWFFENPISGLCLNYKAGNSVFWQTEKTGAILVNRRKLDQFLKKKVQNKKVLIKQERFKGFKQNNNGLIVYSEKDEYKCSYLIDATGATQKTAGKRYRNKKKLKYKALVYETNITNKLKENLPQNHVLLDLGACHKGYGWIFRRKDQVNLGIATSDLPKQRTKRGFKQTLFDFACSYGFDIPAHFRGGAIICPKDRNIGPFPEKLLITGDACGLSDPFLGEGIGQALLTGRLAAQAILADNPDCYLSNIKKGILIEHTHARLLANLVYSAPYQAHRLVAKRPNTLELGFKLLRGEVKHKNLWKYLATRLMGRHPALDRKATDYYSTISN